jgi:hypothetical protein
VGSGVLLDPELGAWVENETDVPTSEVMRAMSRQDRQILHTFGLWAEEVTGGGFAGGNGGGAGGYPEGDLGTSHHGGGPRRAGNLFDRDRYVTPDNVYDQMRLAYQAIENDDVVSGVLESTESVTFSKVSFYADDEDEEDVYNQVAADIDLDSRLREMWRELFSVSQFYCACWWQTKTYKVRGTSEKGNKRRKEITIRAPKSLSLLDPLKVVPVGVSLFRQNRLAYIADRGESENFLKAINGETSDPIVSRLILGPYKPDDGERRWMGEMGIAADHLYELNPATVFRHTATRPDFQRFATVRMKSVFELLDLKHQLRAMDRAHLIGGTNFIILITKGTDDRPASPAEVANLQMQVRTVARLPVLVGDHRLKVEIVTPKLDSTLKGERYNTIDARITARLYQMFMLGNYAAGAGGDDSVKLAKFLAKGLESRRHMLRRTLEDAIFTPMFTRNDQLETAPKMLFHPKQIALDFDSAWATFLLDLRESNEISRNTILSQFDLDQADEARMLEREAEKYDDIFMTQVPFSPPNPKLSPNGQPLPTPMPGPNGGGAGGNGGQAAPAVPPHSHAPTGEPVPIPVVKVRKSAKKAAPAPQPSTRSATRQGGRKGGGNRNGGGSAPGSGQGQAPRNPRKRSS